MLELRDFQAFKEHLRDLLVQTKAFASEDDADQFAGAAAEKRATEQVLPRPSLAALAVRRCAELTGCGACRRD